jgi:hypothetical protein
MTTSKPAHDDEDSGWDHHHHKDGVGTEHHGGNDEGGNVPRQPNRKRTYQERAYFEYDDEYSDGGGGTRRTRPAGGDSSRTKQYRRRHHQHQAVLGAFYSSARAFVEDGPLAALHELGSMGPLAITFLALFLSRQGTRQMLLSRCRYLIDVLRGTFGHIMAAVLVGWDTLVALASIMTPLYGVDDDDSLCGHPDESSEFGALSGRGGRRRRRLMERGSALANIPALEIVKLPDQDDGPVHDDHVGEDASGSATKKGRRKKKRPCHLCGVVHTKGGRRMKNGGYCHEIDPAFRQESEYPSEWLVYDASSGVLPKGFADKGQSPFQSSPPAPISSSDKPSQTLQGESSPEEKKEN